MAAFVVVATWNEAGGVDEGAGLAVGELVGVEAAGPGELGPDRFAGEEGGGVRVVAAGAHEEEVAEGADAGGAVEGEGLRGRPLVGEGLSEGGVGVAVGDGAGGVGEGEGGADLVEVVEAGEKVDMVEVLDVLEVVEVVEVGGMVEVMEVV